MVFIARNDSSFFELITLDALPVSGGGLLVFVIAKLVILAVPDGIRQVLLLHPMVWQSRVRTDSAGPFTAASAPS